MKLYMVPEKEKNKVRIMSKPVVPPAHRVVHSGEVVTFSHIDGFYSLCFDSNNNPIHLSALTEVELVNTDG